MALEKSKRKPRALNGHEVLLQQDFEASGDDPSRALYRGRLLLGSGRTDEAMALLEKVTEPDEAVAEASVLRAQVLRQRGQHTEAWQAVQSLSAGDLVDQRQIVATVIGLVMEGELDQAQKLAHQAIEQRPESGWAHVALSEVWLGRADVERASDELRAAADLEDYPEAHLLRRARVALAGGDRHAAIAHVRKLLQLYPGGGPYLWFYSMLVESEDEIEMFRADLDAAMHRLHPFTKPFDFLVGAHRVLEDQASVNRWLEEGLEAHCEPMRRHPNKDNCMAWYYAMAGMRPDAALRHIDQALEKTGERADFLDTKAMVHLSRGEFQQAETAANAAARLSPDDVYMLWQAERIAQIARAAR